MHSAEVNAPSIGDDQFAVQYTYETTHKPSGQPHRMSEMALYRVRDGRIVREQFFYNGPTT